ncbi:hypothetical protein [Trichoplusia ni ascovirus 2c]|uniref:hypothetical protein n=1 Tax=Trichoplusia ni ascovirus 2c TaxID=328615 RepID=UPI0000E4420D|nr:hypothetical protein TNAV2c_gp053 [Trichoplusia ni ascovirus 2c]ABF70570.1 hypothetical protein [Trichoplusia ni ascovirus 2c]
MADEENNGFIQVVRKRNRNHHQQQQQQHQRYSNYNVHQNQQQIPSNMYNQQNNFNHRMIRGRGNWSRGRGCGQYHNNNYIQQQQPPPYHYPSRPFQRDERYDNHGRHFQQRGRYNNNKQQNFRRKKYDQNVCNNNSNVSNIGISDMQKFPEIKKNKNDIIEKESLVFDDNEGCSKVNYGKRRKYMGVVEFMELDINDNLSYEYSGVKKFDVLRLTQ